MKFRNLFLALILCASVGNAAFSASSSAKGAASQTPRSLSSLLGGRKLHPDFINYLRGQCRIYEQTSMQGKGRSKENYRKKMALAFRLKSVNSCSIEATPENNNLFMAIKKDYRTAYPSGNIFSTASATPPKNNPNKPNSGETAMQKLKRFERAGLKTIAQHEKQKEQQKQQRSYQQKLDENKALAAKDREERLAEAAKLVRFVGKK
jgi:hypothetical protein